MQKFLLLYREAMPTSEPTADEMQAIMKEWTDWIMEGHEAGMLASVGDSLAYEGLVYGPEDAKTDGPYMENKEVCGGFSIAQANSVEELDAYVRKCPSCRSGGSVEIRPMNGVGDDMG